MSVQLTMMEGRQRKKFTATQRLEILREWDSTGNGLEVFRALCDSSLTPVLLEEATGTGGSRVSQGNSIPN